MFSVGAVGAMLVECDNFQSESRGVRASPWSVTFSVER